MVFAHQHNAHQQTEEQLWNFHEEGQLAIDVAEEHNQLSKICAKTTKEAEKKAAAAEEIASKRLLKYKDGLEEFVSSLESYERVAQ